MFALLNIDPVSNAYEQILATGVMGALAIILGYVVYRLYRAKEDSEKASEKRCQDLTDRQTVELLAINKEYHQELKTLTDQLMIILREKSASETKVTEVLQQVVSVQGDVERTLNRFLDRYQFDGDTDSGKG